MNSSLFNQSTLLTIIISALLFVISANPINHLNHKLEWDEVDYVNASKKGFSSNYFETDTLSFFDFVKLSNLKRLSKDDELDLFSQNIVEEKEDLFYLRHFHPPIPIYFWSMFVGESANETDRNIRISSYIFSFFFIVIMTFLIANFSANKTLNLFQQIFLISFFTSASFLSTNLIINFHSFYSLISILFAYSFIKFIQNEQLWKLLSFTCALMLCTLVTSVITLIFAVFFYLLVSKNTLKSIKNVLKIFIYTIPFLILLWPGVLYSGAILKTWLMYFYRIFFAGAEEYNNISLFSSYKELILENPILFLLFLISSIYLIFKIDVLSFLKNPFAIIFYLGFLYMIFISVFSLNLTYFMPALTMMVFGTCLMIGHIKKT